MAESKSQPKKAKDAARYVALVGIDTVIERNKEGESVKEKHYDPGDDCSDLPAATLKGEVAAGTVWDTKHGGDVPKEALGSRVTGEVQEAVKDGASLADFAPGAAPVTETTPEEEPLPFEPEAEAPIETTVDDEGGSE